MAGRRRGALAPGSGSASGDNGLRVVVHLLGLFAGVLGTLILCLAIRDDPPARQHASTALNWLLSLVLYLLSSAVGLGLISIAVPPVLLLFPFVRLGLVLADLVLCTVGAFKAGNGERFTYPATIPFTAAGDRKPRSRRGTARGATAASAPARARRRVHPRHACPKLTSSCPRVFRYAQTPPGDGGTVETTEK